MRHRHGHKKTKGRKIRAKITKPKDPEKKSRHHILPSSRAGVSSQRNIVFIDAYKHQRYHNLFANLTPIEIIYYLADYFWGGQWHYVEEAIQNHKIKERQGCIVI